MIIKFYLKKKNKPRTELKKEVIQNNLFRAKLNKFHKINKVSKIILKDINKLNNFVQLHNYLKINIKLVNFWMI